MADVAEGKAAEDCVLAGVAEGKAAEDAANSFVDVSEGDLIFRTEEAAKPVDPLTEAAALRALFSTEALAATCSRKLGGRWGACLTTWARLEPLGDAHLGAQVLAVADDLEAPHLRAGGIHERLQSGVDAACFGLATLLSNMAVKLDTLEAGGGGEEGGAGGGETKGEGGDA